MATDEDWTFLDQDRVSDLLELLPQDPDLAADLLQLFHRSTEEDLGRLEAAVAGADLKLMEQALHRIAGTSASAGCSDLTRETRAAHTRVLDGTAVTAEEVAAMRALRDQTYVALERVFTP